MIYSASKIQLYRQCRAMYYDRYIARKPKVSIDTSAIFGSALHSAIEHKWSGVDPIARLRRFITTVYNWHARNKIITHSISFSDMQMVGTHILKTMQWGDFKPTSLEFDFTVPLGEYTVHGYIDMIGDYLGNDATVIDFKSSKRKPTQKDVNDDIQFHIYAHAYYTLYGVLPTNVIRYHLRDHSAQYVDLTFHESIMYGVIDTIRAMEKDTFEDITENARICERCPPWCDRKEYART